MTYGNQGFKRIMSLRLVKTAVEKYLTIFIGNNFRINRVGIIWKIRNTNFEHMRSRLLLERKSLMVIIMVSNE